MTAPVFVADQASLAGVRPGSTVRLGGSEGRHAATVRRLRPGEPIDLVDGRGLRVHGRVAAVAGPALDVAVAEVADEPLPVLRVVVAVALIKGDRFDDALSMLTEAGVDEIVPWAAQRSIVQWRGEKAGRAQQRAAAVIGEAGKQSRRARFPVLAPAAGTAQVAARAAAADLALVLHESAVQPLRAVPLPAAGEVLLIVGPEGGIGDEELEVLAAAGARSVRLGPTVQRAATAAVTSTAVVLAGSGRWG